MAKNQGEGDRESAKHYDEDQHKFVESGKVEQAHERNENLSGKEKEEARKAEETGKSHAKK